MDWSKILARGKLVSDIDDETTNNTLVWTTPIQQPEKRIKPRAKANSALWSFFEQKVAPDINGAICKVEIKPGIRCNMEIRRAQGNTSGMRRHLKCKHPEQFKVYIRTRALACAQTLNTIQCDGEIASPEWLQNLSTIQVNVPCDQSLCKYHPNSEQQNRIDVEIMKLIARGNLPFHIIDNQWFKEFVNAINPNANVKHSSTFRNDLCDFLYNDVRTAVARHIDEDLANVIGVTFVFDEWTSTSNDKYQSLSLHYIVAHNEQTDNEKSGFKLCKFLVDCQNFDDRCPIGDNSTSTNLLDMMMMHGIKSLPEAMPKYILSDEDNSMVQGGDYKSEMIKKENHLVCFDHILNNAVEAHISDGDIGRIVKRCRMLALKVRSSAHNNNEIRNACKMTGKTFGEIMQPISAGWSSLMACIRSIFDLRSALLLIKVAEPTKELSLAIPDEAEFDIIAALLPALESLKYCCETLCSENRPSIHLVTVSLLLISNIPRRSMGSAKVVEDFVEAVQREIEAKLPKLGRGIEVYNLGNLLHPKYKGRLLSIGGDQETFKKTINAVCKRFKEEDENEDDESNPPELISTQQSNLELLFRKNIPKSIWDMADEVAAAENLLQQPKRRIPKKTSIEIELETYLYELPSADETELDILAYWFAQREYLPKLSQLAQQILGIPVSCSSSSRVFSGTTGEIPMILTADKTEQLLFIHENFDRVSSEIKSPLMETMEMTPQQDQDQDFHGGNESIR